VDAPRSLHGDHGDKGAAEWNRFLCIHSAELAGMTLIPFLAWHHYFDDLCGVKDVDSWAAFWIRTFGVLFFSRFYTGSTTTAISATGRLETITCRPNTSATGSGTENPWYGTSGGSFPCFGTNGSSTNGHSMFMNTSDVEMSCNPLVPVAEWRS